MTVHFIGAGPGAPDLITVRGRELVRRCPTVLYAGSLVPLEVLAEAQANARIIDTAPLDLEAIIALIVEATAAGDDVARLHSGDPSLYGAIAEQICRLDALAIPWTIVPGVPAYAAAAASLGLELTLPGVAQTVVLTRTAVRASAMPEGEQLALYARSGATLAIHLSINNLARVLRELAPVYGPDGPVIVVHRASWPDELVLRGTVATIRAMVKAEGITRTALILAGPALASVASDDSRLYAADHTHLLRPSRRSSPM